MSFSERISLKKNYFFNFHKTNLLLSKRYAGPSANRTAACYYCERERTTYGWTSSAISDDILLPNAEEIWTILKTKVVYPRLNVDRFRWIWKSIWKVHLHIDSLSQRDLLAFSGRFFFKEWNLRHDIRYHFSHDLLHFSCDTKGTKDTTKKNTNCNLLPTFRSYNFLSKLKFFAK